jgi:hypothetical protein
MIRAVLCSILAACLLGSPAAAQYQVLHGTAVSGGGSASGSHVVYHTIGQPVIGVSIGADNFVKAGFWYCAGISSTVDVAITSIFAELRDDAVLLSWSVSSSGAFEGFNVYRSPEAEDGFERINAAPLPVAGTSSYRDETAEPGRSYRYRIGASSGGSEWYSVEVSIALPPKPLMLHQNYPNPFNPSTNIAFYLPKRTHVRLGIFDVRGALVRTLLNDVQGVGKHIAHWNGINGAGAPVASGVYYYRIEADKQVITKKLVIVR